MTVVRVAMTETRNVFRDMPDSIDGLAALLLGAHVFVGAEQGVGRGADGRGLHRIHPADAH